jgi:hypothetical protein
MTKRAPAVALLRRLSRSVSESRAGPALVERARSNRNVFVPDRTGPAHRAIRRERCRTSAVIRAGPVTDTRAVKRHRPRMRAREMEVIRARSLAG